MADCMEHQQEEEGILNVGNLASEQENNNLDVRKWEDGEVCNMSDENESTDAQDALAPGSDAESGGAAMKQENIEQSGRQPGRMTSDTAEQEKQEPVESEQAGNEETGQHEATTEQRKDTDTVTEAGNASKNKREQLEGQQSQITPDTTESEQGKHVPVESGQNKTGQNEATAEQGKDTDTVTEAGNASKNKREQLEKQQNQITPVTSKASDQENHSSIESEQMAGNEVSGQREATTEQVKETDTVTEAGNASKNKREQLERQQNQITPDTTESEQEKHVPVESGQNKTGQNEATTEQGKDTDTVTEAGNASKNKREQEKHDLVVSEQNEATPNEAATVQGKGICTLTEAGNTSHKKRKDLLAIESAGKPSIILPQGPLEPTTVYFYLFIPEDYKGYENHPVVEANIHFHGNTEPIPLYRVEKLNNLWYCKITFHSDPTKYNLKYQYSMQYQAYQIKYLGFLRGNNPTCESRKDRTVRRHVQLDIFIMPDERHVSSETIPNAVIWYLQWFMQFVTSETISEILVYIEYFNSRDFSFRFLPKDYVEKMSNWIFQKSSDNSIKDIQQLYLCMILSNLGDKSTLSSRLNKNKTVCDRFLECFGTCVQYNVLSKPDHLTYRKHLLGSAIILVKNSSNPGWLTLAAHFYPSLGIKFLLDPEANAITHYTYKIDEYKKLVAKLFSCIKVEDQVEHQNLLLLVLKSAPTLLLGLNIFERPELLTLNIFATEDERVDFFVKYYLEAQNTREGKSLRESLTEFCEMSSKILDKIPINMVNQILVEYAQSEDEVGKDMAASVEQLLSVVSKKSPDKSKFTEMLDSLSKSLSVPRQDLLLGILNNADFKELWRKIPDETKVEICQSWIISRVTKIDGSDSRTKAEQVYDSMDEIMRCHLNTSIDKKLCPEVLPYLLKDCFKPEDNTDVLAAFEKIKNFLPSVQDCYISHVKKVLTPELIKSSTEILEKCANDSLGRKILVCVLEFIDNPGDSMDTVTDEDRLNKILDWCDVWRILCKITISESNKNFKRYKDGVDICEDLSWRIEKGDISSHFLEKIDEKKEKVSKLCKVIENNSTDSRRPPADRISELMNVVDNCDKNIQLLQSVIDHCKSYFAPGSPGIRTIIQKFNDVKTNWRDRKVCELEDHAEFWGWLQKLLCPAEGLRLLVNSLSFWAVAKNGWKEELPSADKTEDETTTAVNYFLSLLKYLTNEAEKIFQKQWSPVLNDPDSVGTATMDILLVNISDQKALDKELTLLGDYFKREFSSDAKSYLKDYMKCPIVLKGVQRVSVILENFKLADHSEETMLVLSQFETALKNRKTLTIAKLQEHVKKVEKTIPWFSEEDFNCVTEELSRSCELLSFLEEMVDEDIRFLIDAFDEQSDQLVAESSVSDLIEVHSFLAPLIKMKNEKKSNVPDFLQRLNTSCDGRGDITVKIRQCNAYIYGLRGLYGSIANRGETTKGKIRNFLDSKEKSLEVAQANGKWEITIKGVKPEYSLSHLHDLRSRARITRQKNASQIPFNHSEETSVDFDEFINQVNLVTEISILVLKLQMSGYDKYWKKYWTKMKTTDDLQSTKDSLQEDLEKWENKLKEAREKFYFLNYYRSDQLCTLIAFLRNGSNIDYNDVSSLIHFVDKTVDVRNSNEFRAFQETLQKSYRKDKNNPESLLTTLGEGLENIFGNRKIPNDDQKQTPIKVEATVVPGKIYVANLEANSLFTTNVMLELYKNTSNSLPEPNQVVFCSSQTNWEDVHLLLQRCFAHSRIFTHKKLFCIANVELLPSELQFKLVEAIKDKLETNTDYLLALICRGGDHHHIVEEFSEHSHHIAGMSDDDIAKLRKHYWPNVKTFTSTLPGLGKTEQIKHEALEKDKNIETILVVGPFEPCKLIQALKKHKLKKFHCLHLDIGEVSDSLSLNTFLFQLIVTGMVSAGNQFYHLPETHVYIEIANTLNDWLRESLVVSKYFTHEHLEWQNCDNLLVSDEITSNIQVVCQYLNLKRIESEEVHFSGPQKVKPLREELCKKLLAEYFSPRTAVTFTTLQTFLRHFANQLLKFSRSTFFKIKWLESMAGNEGASVRKDLFEALLEVSRQFSSMYCSSDTRNLSQKETTKSSDKAMVSTAENMVERAQGIIQWEKSNHLVVVFHGLNSHAITAMYRRKDRVPDNIKKLLASQGLGEDEDFKEFTQEQLQERLEKIACTKLSKLVNENNLFSSYALTSDNILKMILIILRVRANIPVIIMGETGCGKTSLVRYLANTCKVKFFPFNVHAGTSEKDIITFIEMKEGLAREEQIWIFLDEINTCDHLGLINDIMCHHSLLGRPLSKNLVFVAACNPYKLRPKEHIKTAGLEGKNVTDEYSKLVYRVHPLPEAMIGYVWDYGSLSPKDERDYIERMVRRLHGHYENVLVDLLAASQEFIRNTENNPFCVSLRDVHRCIQLISWFEEMTNGWKKESCITRNCPEHLQAYHRMSKEFNQIPMIKSTVLALAHCYMSRLPTAELRKKYRKEMIGWFHRNGTIRMECGEELDSFLAIVRMEEEDYLHRMELPPGTARNAALRENVFVMLVCILNRIPIFVVGKPGCSKSLSIQLIRSNLRGRNSRDPLFRKFPQLYFVSYQGSESSTSEGIEKVFEKARKYKAHNKDILPVVLLDEVGLAENSKYNPLKVLHNLLEPCRENDKTSEPAGEEELSSTSEPEKEKLPDVAVVGISNWSLDAAKMNRAIHLSRPEPTKEDLYETGRSIYYASSEDNNKRLDKRELRCLAQAYFEYQAEQKHANFHGLRDYYSLIKSLTGCSDMFRQVNLSLQRNFGGLPSELTNIQKIFLNKLKKLMTLSDETNIIPVTELIQANLEDPHARHLMLITSGDSATGILKPSLAQLQKETITIYGSRFEEDLSEEYNYRILSRIILCMEQNCVLILKDLESIYGSLYDMLNQNYAVVGNRKNCRVALGPYSNPMCQVNDGFRCIVLIDHHNVNYSDPPFLNRFEKQVLRFSDVLTDDQRKTVTELQRWVDDMSTVEGLESHFKETDMFIGFHEDTLPSLVLSHSHDTASSPDVLLKKCKDDLMWIASPDAVLRRQKCTHLKEHPKEMLELSDEFFKKPLHHGFASFMEHVMAKCQETSFCASDEIGSKTVVMTFSNIHTDIGQCLAQNTHSVMDQGGLRERCQVERLSAYKSEKQLTERINEFWHSSQKDLLVLQCKSDLDGAHLLLTRSIIEEKRNSYKQYSSSDTHTKRSKHVCIVVHVQRGETTDGVPWQFSFLCGWRQVFLDMLEAPPVSITEIRGKSIKTLLTPGHILSITKIAEKHLLWCFTCIKYTRSQRALETILKIARNLFSSRKVSDVIKQLILQSIDPDALEHKNWQFKVACDRQSLVNSSTFYCAIERFFSRLVRNSLAKIVYFLEKENAWPPHLADKPDHDRMSELENLWCKLFMDPDAFKISEMEEPRGTECYTLESTSLDLCLPFSQRVVTKIDAGIKELFLDHYATLIKNESNLDENSRLTESVRQQALEKFTENFRKLCYYAPEFSNLYMNDVFDIATSDLSLLLNRDVRVSIAKAVFVSEVRNSLPKDIPEDMAKFCTLLHTFVWLHSQQILDILRMVHYCRLFVDPDLVHQLEKSSTHVVGKVTHYQDSERFADVLVTSYCEKMLPSPEVVQKSGGPKLWIRNANLLLSLAVKISENSPAVHYLRLCIDFSTVILTRDPSREDLLSHLIKIGEILKPNYLDHQDSFQKIFEEIITPLDKEVGNDRDKQEALQRFSALFYSRCIDANIGTDIIVEQIFSLERPELVIVMSPVVSRFLEQKKVQSFEQFEDLIDISNDPCLQSIDQLFKERFAKGLIHHDSYPAVMVCDLIQRLLNFKDRYRIDDIDDSANSEVLLFARDAAAILIAENSEDVRGLQLLTAVAFLRGFFTMFAKFFAENHSVEIKNNLCVQEMENVILRLKERKSSFETFFVKQVHEHASLFDLQQKCFNESNALPTIKELWPEEKYQDKALFTSVFKYPEYDEAKAAYRKKMESKDGSSMQEFLTKCEKSSKHAFALLGLLINMTYLKRTVRKLTDNENEMVEWLAEKVPPFSRSFGKLFMRIIGHDDFRCPKLQLSTESSVEEVELALLILHIACVVATGERGKHFPMRSYLTNLPKRYCVLAHDKEDVRSVFEHQSSVKDSVCITCACGSRWAVGNNVDEKKCPNCQQILIDGANSMTSSETLTTQLVPGNGDTSHEWDLCTKHMTPAVYRALHLIVYSSFYAGIALQTTSEEQLSDILNVLHGSDHRSVTTTPANFCFERIKTDVLCLTKILNCNQNVAIKNMHRVIEESSDLIRGDLHEFNDSLTQTKRQEWEAMFSQCTEEVFLNARETPNVVKEMMKLQQTGDSDGSTLDDESTLESHILELDDYPENPQEQNQQLKRLLRVTKQPCLQDFRSAFLFLPKVVQEKHSFLMLFFAKFDQLSILGNLRYLLEWSRLVSSELNARISRKDVQSKSIKDFIEGRLSGLDSSQREIESLRNVFTKFKEGWEKMRPLVDQKLVTEKQNMPTLTDPDLEDNCLAYCLDLTGNDCSVYLRTAIEILVSYQNSILDAINSLSSHLEHPALCFLERGNYRSVSIQEVKEKEIISFQWSDVLFKYAQNNLEYGKGREINYDFERIEMELATEIAFGRCYLTGTLSKFIFTNDLLHSCGPLLTEIRSMVKQSPNLPPRLLQDLSSLKQRRITDIPDLLQRIAVLIFLVKKKGASLNVDMTLKEFAKSCFFSVALPSELTSPITILYITAFYEALEDMLADGAIEGLDEKFRDELPGEMKTSVRDIGKIDQFKPHNLLKALRRFVFRCLSSDAKKYWPEKDEALKFCLNEDSLWFPLDKPDVEEMPQDITLKYIYSMMKYLKEISPKKMKTSYSKTSSSQSIPRSTKASRRHQLQGTIHAYNRIPQQATES